MAKTSSTFAIVVPATVALFVLAPADAQAQYLDPGSGSIMVQAIIAVVVGLSATVKIYWHRIAAFMDRRAKAGTETRR